MQWNNTPYIHDCKLKSDQTQMLHAVLGYDMNRNRFRRSFGYNFMVIIYNLLLYLGRLSDKWVYQQQTN